MGYQHPLQLGDSRISANADIRARWQAELRDPIFRHAAAGRSGKLLGIPVTRTNAGDGAQLTLGTEPIVFTFDDIPPHSDFAALNLACDPDADTDFVITVTVDGVSMTETIKPSKNYNLETIELDLPPITTGTLAISVTSPRDLSCDGPGVDRLGIPPTLVVVAPASRSIDLSHTHEPQVIVPGFAPEPHQLLDLGSDSWRASGCSRFEDYLIEMTRVDQDN